MYLHLGFNTVIDSNSILGIFDLDNSSQSKHTQHFLNRCQKDGIVVTVGEDLPKSFILSGNNGKFKIYLTQISSSTIQKRSGNFGK